MILRFVVDLAVPFTNYADMRIMPTSARNVLVGAVPAVAMSA